MDSQYLNLFTLFYLNRLELNLSLLTWRRAIACPFFPPSQPVFIPAVWKIIVPPKIHVFLWLLSNNKLMTVDNLAERGIHKPLDCKFCSEKESVHHLFFDCIVARQLWACLSDFNGSVINSYFDMASKWIAPKKYKSTNTISAGVVWCMWLIRNDFVFRGQHWSSIKMVLGKLWSITKEWMLMCPASMEEEIDRWCSYLVVRLKIPLAICF